MALQIYTLLPVVRTALLDNARTAHRVLASRSYSSAHRRRHRSPVRLQMKKAFGLRYRSIAYRQKLYFQYAALEMQHEMKCRIYAAKATHPSQHFLNRGIMNWEKACYRASYKHKDHLAHRSR